MPLYVYRCPKGHEVEALVKHDSSNAPVTCVHEYADNGDIPISEGTVVLCGEPLTRVMATNAKLFPGADSWRK